MNHPADTETPLDVPTTPIVGKEAGKSTTTEAQIVALSSLPNENRIDEPKENNVQAAKAESASSTEQPIVNGAQQKAIATEQEVQSATQETDANSRGDAEQSNDEAEQSNGNAEQFNGDASGNVRIPVDADLSKPERENGEQLEGGNKKVRRSSTLSTIT
ncbi:hypothetical protein ACEPAG_8727 [Sanghuangporus baumii]